MRRGGAVLRMQVVRGAGVGYYVRDLVPGRAEGQGWRASPRGGGPGAAARRTRPAGHGRRPSSSPRSWPAGTRRGRRAAMPGGDRVPSLESTSCSSHPSRPASSISSDPARWPRPPAPPTKRPWPMPSATWSGTRAACGVSGGAVHLLPATGAVRPDSSTGPAGPSTPISTPIWCRPMWPKESTGCGLRSTPGGSSCTGGPSAPSTTLRSATSCPTGSAWRGNGDPPGGWEVAGVDPVLHRLFSQRAASIDEHAHRAGRGASVGAVVSPSTPTDRTRSGATPSTGSDPAGAGGRGHGGTRPRRAGSGGRA